MLFVVYCKDKPGDLRARLRPLHLRHVLANPKPYRFGGPLLSDGGQVIGSFILFEVDDRAQLDAVMAADPYFRDGLYQSVEIHASRQVMPETAPGSLQQELDKELAKGAR